VLPQVKIYVAPVVPQLKIIIVPPKINNNNNNNLALNNFKIVVP